MSQVIRLLEAAAAGNRQAAAELLPLVYDELRRLAASRMAGERPGHSLDPTALVHEAYLRLIGDRSFANRGHFFAAAAEAMRCILVDNARHKRRVRHGGDLQRQPLPADLASPAGPSADLVALDAALTRFAARHPVHAKLVELRYFTGISGDEAAQILGVSPSTADRHWVFARAWLRRELRGDENSPNS